MYICTHYHFICKALNSIQGCGLDGVIIDFWVQQIPKFTGFELGTSCMEHWYVTQWFKGNCIAY